MRIFSVVLICFLTAGSFSCGSYHPIHRRLGSPWTGMTAPSLAVVPNDALGNQMILALNHEANDLIFLAPELANLVIKLEHDPRGYFSISAKSRLTDEVLLERVWILMNESDKKDLVIEFAQDFITNFRGTP